MLLKYVDSMKLVFDSFDMIVILGRPHHFDDFGKKKSEMLACTQRVVNWFLLKLLCL